MGTNVTIIGLGDCLKSLANTGRLAKAHPVNVRAEGTPDKYTTYFLIPKKAATGKDRFEVTINTVFSEDADAAKGAVLTQEKAGDVFLVTTFSAVTHHDVVRALRTFVAANNMLVALDESPAAADRIPGIINRVWQSASERPLPGTNVNDVLDVLETTINRVSPNVLKRAMVTPLDMKDVLDELRWVANRWNTFEYGLIRLAQGKTTTELEALLETRAGVLYWLFDRDSNGASNEEIIDLCKQSNNPKFTDTLTFRAPSGYEGGAPLKLMEAALRSIEIYERNYAPFVPEPEYLIVTEVEGGTRRVINHAWMEWYYTYGNRSVHPLDEVRNRVLETYKDRADLKGLDIRVKELGPEEMFTDGVKRYEVLVSYQAFL